MGINGLNRIGLDGIGLDGIGLDGIGWKKLHGKFLKNNERQQDRRTLAQ